MNRIFVFISCLLFLACSQKAKDCYDCEEIPCNDCEEVPLWNCENAHLWDYPVKPGMEEWGLLKTQAEKSAACQIPCNLLDCLSTEKLTDLCLQYPLFLNVYVWNILDMGIDNMFGIFNGIRELYSREMEDVVNCLIKRYLEKIQSLSFFEEHIVKPYLEAIETFRDEENYNELITPFALNYINFIRSITNVDVLFSRVEKEDNDIKEILSALVAGYEAMCGLEYDVESGYNFFARAHVIIKICPECIEKFPMGNMNNAFHSERINSETMNIINELSYQLIK